MKALGQTWESHQKAKAQTAWERANHLHDMTDKTLKKNDNNPLKKIIYANAYNILRLQCNATFTGWYKPLEENHSVAINNPGNGPQPDRNHDALVQADL